jgi:dTDP-4-amino-4,6-dideoxygalactose transaminase
MRVIAGGHTPNAKRMLEQVVYLPLTPGLRQRDIGRMAAIVNRTAATAHARAA